MIYCFDLSTPLCLLSTLFFTLTCSVKLGDAWSLAGLGLNHSYFTV